MPHKPWTIWFDTRLDASVSSHPWCMEIPGGQIRGEKVGEVAEVLTVFHQKQYEQPTPENVATWVKNHPGLRWIPGG